MHASKLIIANSTYSWWAAYLNENATEIIAPKYWMGHRKGQYYPKDIFLNVNWQLVE
jgi:hypothetical protein